MTAETSDDENRRHRGRRVVAGGVIAGLALVAGTAVGVAGNGGDGRDGRDTSDLPSAPVDDVDVVEDVSDGRPGDPEAPPAPAKPTVNASTADGAPIGGESAIVLDNGRGGVDPEVGPLAPTAPPAPAATLDQAVGPYDTDSGKAPTELPQLGRASGDEFGGSDGAPVDQDVPGAPTMSEPGDDLAFDDSDG